MSKQSHVRTLCLIFGITILVCIATLFLYPHSLIMTNDNITVVSIPNDVTVKGFTAYPSGNTMTFTISQDDTNYQTLMDCLSDLKYTYCIHSFLKVFPDKVKEKTFLLEIGEHSLYFTGGNHIAVDGTVYKVKETNLYDLCLNMTFTVIEEDEAIGEFIKR